MRTSSLSKLSKQFIERWSPRAFLSDKISQEDLMTLFEAARWSPSCFNAQPWFFVYASKTEDLMRFQSVLNDSNRVWASKAPVLVLLFARKNFTHNDKPNRWADFDSGAAWMALNLQAKQQGLYCHGMGGFDQTKAYEVAGVDAEKFNVLCAIAIGKQGAAALLPNDLQEIEKPSPRNPLEKIISEAKFNSV